MSLQATESIRVASIQECEWGAVGLHEAVTFAKSIIPKELRIGRTHKRPLFMQEYHSGRLKIALGQGSVDGMIGCSATDYGLTAAAFRAKFEHVLFYRTSKADMVGFVAWGDSIG